MSAPEGHVDAPAAPAWRRRLWPFLKWGLFALVVIFVGRRAMVLWQQVSVSLTIENRRAERDFRIAWTDEQAGPQRTRPISTGTDAASLQAALRSAGLRRAVVVADTKSRFLISGIPGSVRDIRATATDSGPAPVRLEAQSAGEKFGQVKIRYSTLCLAGLLYGLGWIPSIWFWRKLMHSCGSEVGVADAAAAYFCGHLGKYIPGKASVLVIRAGLIRKRGGAAGLAALTAAYETLAMMGVGLALGLALAPLLFGPRAAQVLPVLPVLSPVWQAVFPLLVGAAGLALLPTISQLFTKLARSMPPPGFGHTGETPRPTPAISARLLLAGSAAFLVAWALHGLSLGLTVGSITDAPFEWSHWPMWTACVALATSIGFAAVFAPGGLGVREALLIETLRLQVGVSAHAAVTAAVLLRVVWFAAEIVLAVVLYLTVFAARRRRDVNEGTS